MSVLSVRVGSRPTNWATVPLMSTPNPKNSNKYIQIPIGITTLRRCLENLNRVQRRTSVPIARHNLEVALEERFINQADIAIKEIFTRIMPFDALRSRHLS